MDVWVLKPGQGTNSNGLFVCSTTAAACAHISSPANASGDYVAQLLVPRPLTVLGGRKYDLRAFVFVRSFVPFEAYLHALLYARVSNKVYEPDKLSDDDVFLTVTSYKEGLAPGVRLTVDKLAPLSDADSPDSSSFADVVLPRIRSALADLFEKVAPAVGAWPRSRAYYGCDLIVGHDGLPKLLEVNYMGDFSATKEAVKQSQGGDLAMFYEWGEDLLTTLATDVNLENHPRLSRLKGKY